MELLARYSTIPTTTTTDTMATSVARRAVAAPFRYRYALVRPLPASFAGAALRASPVAIDQARAVAQHEAYAAALRATGVTVITLPAADALPDSCFIEDTAVAVGDTVFITRPGAPSRVAETTGVHEAVAALGGYTLVDASAAGADVAIDGGDVMWTGAELFVGLGGRTNDRGVAALAAAFPTIPVIPLRLADFTGGGASHGDGPLHLKSIVSMAPRANTVLAPDSAMGRSVVAAMTAASAVRARYTPLLLPHAPAANVVVVNGITLIRGDADLAASTTALQCALPVTLTVDVSEIAKADAALTCCSLLLA